MANKSNIILSLFQFL